MLNLFISYSHQDETLVAKFLNHLSPLKSNGQIVEWFDRMIDSGESFQNNIDDNFDSADIICLMISDNFLASQACIKEKDRAIKLRNKMGNRVIPIILSPCAWNMYQDLSECLALPTDGKPITTFSDQNEGWLNTVIGISKLCTTLIQIKNLIIRDEFNEFLNSADILSKSHQKKETLNLEDIFVFPMLKSYDNEEVSHKYDSEKLKTDILFYNKIIIAGETQSGKTTLCKILFQFYRRLNYIPVYLEDENKYLGNPIYKLERAFNEQYQSGNLSDFDSNRVVPIVDNFHFAKHQEKYIEQYTIFNNQVLIVDEIFGLNISNQNRIKEYSKFKIREFSALERNDLINKWIQIKEGSHIEINPNHIQQSIDEKTEMIENSLGKIFGKGIMPSYPFYILSLLAAQDTNNPLNSEITSQGHCYQALIYLYLRKQGVKNDQIDIYTNMLTELAFCIYENNGQSLDDQRFQEFLKYYKSKFNLPLPTPTILHTLSKVNICKFDSLNQFNFCYSYLYYFFVAKYLSEHIESKRNLINQILLNLHKDENAYITVFIAHHTKSNYVLDELSLNAEILFENYHPTSLDTNELKFFDEHEDKIIKAILPSFEHNSAEERKRLLLNKSKSEDLQANDEQTESFESEERNDDNKETIELITNLRRSIKTVEVMGLIIKNRSGSLDKQRLEYIYEQGMKVHLRILSSFIELISDDKAEKEFVNLLRERISAIIKEKEEEDQELNIDKIEKLARAIYWNINFGVLHGFVTKAIHSLGSSNLINISQAVSDSLKTPSAFIINQGIRMWYGKNLRIKEISERTKNNDFSKTAKYLIQYKIVEHCRMHNIDYKDLKLIEKELQIPTIKMLAERSKSKMTTTSSTIN